MFTNNTAHVVDALARLAQQFKRKPKFKNFVSSFIGQTQGVEDALWSLEVETVLDNAVGAQLDLLGRIVGEERGNSVDDDEYRKRIKVRILVNRSSGTTPDIFKVFRALEPNGSFKLVDFYPAGFVFESQYASSDDAVLYARFLRLARAGGVYAVFTYWPAEDEDDLFTCALSTNTSQFVDVDGPNYNILVEDTSNAPPSGFLKLSPGLPNEEVVEYTNKTSSPPCFYGVTTLFEHDAGSCVVILPPNVNVWGQGWGSDTNPNIGGMLIGAVVA